jgi:hypothetical protein
MNVKFDEVYNPNDNFLHVQKSIDQKSIDQNQYYSKKPFTYDDILSSMNLVVSSAGVLQYMKTKTDSEVESEFESQLPIHTPINNNVGPELKHSYIYNKYYKNYKDPEQNVIQKPLTREEYKQVLINDYIQRKQNKQRIAHIKPKRMAFTTTHPIVNHTQLYASTNNSNHLFKIRFQQ